MKDTKDVKRMISEFENDKLNDSDSLFCISINEESEITQIIGISPMFLAKALVEVAKDNKIMGDAVVAAASFMQKNGIV